MIPAEQMDDALKAMQGLIIRARFEAYEAGAVDVGDLLDDMELLPEMVGGDDDRAGEFRDALEGIALKYPRCRHAVEQFLGRPEKASSD